MDAVAPFMVTFALYIDIFLNKKSTSIHLYYFLQFIIYFANNSAYEVRFASVNVVELRRNTENLLQLQHFRIRITNHRF
jgi:hypothetical protein